MLLYNALIAAEELKISLVIDNKGYWLCDITSYPQAYSIPFVFTGEKKFNVKNVNKKSALSEAIIIPEKTSGIKNQSSGIRGNIQHLGLPSLFTILEMENKSGVLKVINSQTKERGEILFSNGRLVTAQIPGSALQNEEAIYYMLTWSEGDFEFAVLDFALKSNSIKSSVTSILMEGARRLDESKK